MSFDKIDLLFEMYYLQRNWEIFRVECYECWQKSVQFHCIEMFAVTNDFHVVEFYVLCRVWISIPIFTGRTFMMYRETLIKYNGKIFAFIYLLFIFLYKATIAWKWNHSFVTNMRRLHLLYTSQSINICEVFMFCRMFSTNCVEALI